MSEWTRAQRRHLAAFLGFGRVTAPTVYDSLGEGFFATLAPDWLNLGLWDGPGVAEEAPAAARRLVATLAGDLPVGGRVLDVGNGLGVQDPLIAEVARPRTLVALNITESQLRAGAAHLAAAGARPVRADATRLPVRAGSMDGVISVEAAFHFPSRAAFFAEARRVLRPGGVLTMSDVSTDRLPRTPGEAVAGLTSLRFWGLGLSAPASAERIARLAGDAGFADVRVERVGKRVFEPVLAFLHTRLAEPPAGVPAAQWRAARLMARQWRLLRRRGLIDYILLRATNPSREGQAEVLAGGRRSAGET